MSCSERKIKILKGRRKTFDLFVQNEKGQPKSVSGWSIIRVKINHASGCLTKYAPVSTGIDEVQKLDLKAADAGNFKLKFQEEITSQLDFDSTAAEIQTALNALNELSGVAVVDQGSGVFEITFSGSDAKREQPMLIISEHDLTLTGSAVDPVVTEETKGEEASGIEIVSEEQGHLKVTLSTDDVALLEVKNDQDIDLYIRIGTEDLDLDPALLQGVLDVEEIQCSGC